MNAQQLIQEVTENASEYLEMTENPSALVAGILANKVIQLQGYVRFLEKMVDHARK